LSRNTILSGSIPNLSYSTSFHLKNPEVLDILIEVLQNETAWLKANKKMTKL